MASACASPTPVADSVTSSSSTSTSLEATTTTTPLSDAGLYDVLECSSAPPVDFALLCETHELVSAHYVDATDDAALAAAAALGLAAIPGDPEARPRLPIKCAIPSAEFEPLCLAVVGRLQSDPAPVADLVEGAVQGLFQYGLDPFSSYVPPDLADRLDDLVSGAIYSLGLIVGARDAVKGACSPIGGTCRFSVLAVDTFGPADQSGLVPGDEITAIDGQPVAGRSADEATALMIGEPGWSVTLTVQRGPNVLEKMLIHEDIRFVPAEYELLTPSIAYLRVNDFSQLSAQLTGRVLQLPEVKAAGALILDLRGNPGGLVLAAQAIASQFLDDGLVMVERSRDETVELPVIEGGLGTGLRLVVLVDRASASASEIVAAVLKERGRATIIGTSTFGKNLVQQVFTARNGGEIRVSVARWTAPEGLDIGIRGLEPDIVVDPAPDTEGDPALEQAVAFLGG